MEGAESDGAPSGEPGDSAEAPSAGGSRRVAALVEYDGTGFSGWQSQSHSASIQDAVEAAVGFVAGHRLICICAGRTDAGVHAAGQVIHFDTSSKRTPRAWVLGANTKLPPTVALQWAGEVDRWIPRPARRDPAHLPLLHPQPQRPLGVAAQSRSLDPPAARRAGHALRRPGTDRRA